MPSRRTCRSSTHGNNTAAAFTVACTVHHATPKTVATSDTARPESITASRIAVGYRLVCVVEGLSESGREQVSTLPVDQDLDWCADVLPLPGSGAQRWAVGGRWGGGAAWVAARERPVRVWPAHRGCRRVGQPGRLSS